MRLRAFFYLAMVCNLILYPFCSHAWGPTGHAYIGEAALDRLDSTARDQVQQILSPASAERSSDALIRACFWPDEIRKTAGWEWSGPLHYVNIPRNSERYDRQRDCGDGICVTEGIRKYAQQLTVDGLSLRQRWEALAWLCHLVADLHQPLHAGFRDDRGGNRVNFRFQGETVNLHRFWDGELVRSESAEVRSWSVPGANDRPPDGVVLWNPASVDLWTEESHRIAAELAYPPGKAIDADFTRQSLGIIREQWEKAASRLALILNAVLGEGRVDVGD